MANLKLEHVYKIYKGKKKSDDFLAVEDFNLESDKKEFLVFVGPSGCGKSTTLRMIAGLEEISSGKLYIDGELMNHVEPKYRNIALVFQNYALYPHMSAYENMAFGLRNIKVPTPVLDESGNPILEIDQKVVKNLEASLKKANARLEKAKKKGDEAALSFAQEEIAKLQEQKEYFSSTPIPKVKEVHLKKEEIDRRIHEAARILDIETLLDRLPKAMSGGQRQRVALGRAIVRTPKLFLLDEPLSNLDAKLRSQMRVEISKLYEKLDTTFVYVTHDQVEAMTMGTRIVVMRDGKVQQIDTPTNIYDYPANRFVAGFLGTPQMNFFEVKITKSKQSLIIEFASGQTLRVGLSQMRKLDPEYLDGETHDAILGIRPEHCSLEKGNYSLKAKVTLSENLGNETIVYAETSSEESSTLAESNTSIVIKTKERIDISRGEEIDVSLDVNRIHLFSSSESAFEKSILLS